MEKKSREPDPTPATDFVYTFHLWPSGEIRHDSVAGAFEQITGYAENALKERGWTGLIYPKDQPALANRASALKAGNPDVREYRLITADGRLKWIRDYAQPMRTEADGSIFVFAAAQEITAQNGCRRRWAGWLRSLNLRKTQSWMSPSTALS